MSQKEEVPRSVPRSRTIDIEAERFPIRTLATNCHQRFQLCIADPSPSLQQNHWAENRATEFNIWDAGVGACADELNCLDKRLEHDVSAKKVVIGALSTLGAWIQECFELSTKSMSPDTRETSNAISLDEAKKAVETLLKAFVDLEIAINRAGTACRIRTADRTFDKRRSAYQDVSRHLEFILRVYGARREIPVSGVSDDRPGTAQRSTVARNEINVQSAISQLEGEKTPLRPEQEVLILANLKRHDRFVFFRGRQVRLKLRQTQEPAQAVREQVSQPLAPFRETQSQSEIKTIQNMGQSDVVSVPALKSHYLTGTTNQASGFTPASSLEKVAGVTNPGIAATTIALRADYPKPPKDESKCPYCFISLKRKVMDVRWWK